jgi:hypothetical protein
MRTFLPVLIATSAFGVLACGPDSASGVDASVDSSSPGDGSPDGTTQDAGVDAADAATDATDAGACGLVPVDGGACNGLATSGAAVVPSCKAGSAPTATGGTIPDGHYVLTKLEFYNVSVCPTDQEKIDWVICGSAWETVQSSTGSPAANHVNATVTASGNTLSLARTCPNAGNSSFTYDVPAGGLVIYLPQLGGVRAGTYTKM